MQKEKVNVREDIENEGLNTRLVTVILLVIAKMANKREASQEGTD